MIWKQKRDVLIARMCIGHCLLNQCLHRIENMRMEIVTNVG